MPQAVTPSTAHQYIERATNAIVTEQLFGDRSVSFLYNTLRENAPALFRALTSARMSSLLSLYHYDFLDSRKFKAARMIASLAVDLTECVAAPDYYDTPRKVFERQIRYWQLRPMEEDRKAIVSPADSRVLVGSFTDISELFIKEKFFSPEELFGTERKWHNVFSKGDFGVFRLTPDKYHYNHVPVSGIVLDIYEIDGAYHSCNPAAQIALASLYAKNKRVVTIIDTDIEGGSGVGRVAMIEVVALMIGDIVQAYSELQYHNPQPVQAGMFLEKGCPKSLYRPGSSTDILVFEPNRISFSPDILANAKRNDVQSRFTNKVGRPLVETEVSVRSTVAGKLP
ncbi:phosphatidylserine decarboxylase [Desulfosediminicola sp.]|uniref:phosphatidylserine decarboxylase n=1 Tax=Desulfosediminicola sp. TaxID=2886825 RepID=UPI003AF2903D